MTPKEYKAARQKLTSSIRAQTKGLLWESGYGRGEGNGKGYRLWVPVDKKGNFVEKEWVIKGAFVLHTLQGFGEDGFITDGFAGGLATIKFEQLPIEDLFRVDNWLRRMLPTITANDVYRKAKIAKLDAEAKAKRVAAEKQAAVAVPA